MEKGLAFHGNCRLRPGRKSPPILADVRAKGNKKQMQRPGAASVAADVFAGRAASLAAGRPTKISTGEDFD
jgi:hypothetical protein